MTQFEVLLAALKNGGVSFIIIGGVAATLHGRERAAAVVFNPPAR
jgi:hypothetical protein